MAHDNHPLLDNTTPALRRCWHAVATSEEVGDAPHQVWLLGEPWVLVRLGGTMAAFSDRCPHRLAPLSAGSVCGTLLQCGYHGWQFEADGTCARVPALPRSDRLPRRAGLTAAAAVEERYGLVWLAPDEPVEPISEFPEWTTGEYDTASTAPRRTPVSAGQLVDNFLDAAHFPYVHAQTFGVEESAEVHDSGVVRDGWRIRTQFDTWYRNLDDPLVASGEHDAVQPQELLKIGSASTTIRLRLHFPVTGATLAILFVCQPETTTSTRVYKLIARNDFAGDVERMAACVKEEDVILDEDLAILERYTEMVLHLDSRVELHTKADRLSLGWRRLMADLLAAAGPGPRQAATSGS